MGEGGGGGNQLLKISGPDETTVDLLQVTPILIQNNQHVVARGSLRKGGGRLYGEGEPREGGGGKAGLTSRKATW